MKFKNNIEAHADISVAGAAYINQLGPTGTRAEELQLTGTMLISEPGSSATGLNIGYGGSGTNSVQIGRGRIASGVSYLDLQGDTGGVNPGFRILRSAGANASTAITHYGTANLTINAQNGADTVFTNTKVGIGTTSPNTALEVDGAISTTTSDYVQGSTGSRLLLETSGSGNTHSYIQAQNAGGTSSNEDLALQLYGGSVGIGTSSPGAKLEISDTTLAETRITSYPASGYSGQSNLWLRTGQYGDSMIALGHSFSGTAATAAAGIRYADFNDLLTIKTNSSDRLTINSSGTVRILGSGSASALEFGTYGGKISSTYSTLETSSNLTVNGNVTATDYINQRVAWNAGYAHTSNSTSSWYYIPVGYISRTTSNTYYNNWAAQYGGRVKKIVTTNIPVSTVPTANTISYRVTVNGTVVFTSSTISITGTGYNQKSSYTFTDTDATFNAGDIVQVSYNTNGLLGYAATGISIEYTE